MRSFTKPFFVFKDDDGAGGGGSNDDGNNNTIRQLRSQIDSLNSDLTALKTSNTDLQTKLTAKERAEMDEITRLKAEKDDLIRTNNDLTNQVGGLTPLNDEVTGLKDFITKMFNDGISAIPKEKQDAIRQITFIENNPVESLNKLNVFMKEFNTDGKLGTITNPTNGTPNVNGNGDGKVYKPGQVGWGDAFRPADELVAEAEAKFGRNKINSSS